jgi:UDP-arabinose 4-epimerase
MFRHGINTIVFSSSCATYGIPDALPIVESALQRPINPYGRTKLFGEQILLDTALARDLRVGLLRYFNAAGADPDGELVERHDPETHLIPRLIDAAIGKGPPVQVFGADYPTADGTCERDFIHVTDLALAHVACLHHLHAASRMLTLNLGTGMGYSVRSVVAAVERVTGRRVPLEEAARRPGDPPILVADASLARKTIGFAPKFSDLDTIVETAWRARA